MKCPECGCPMTQTIWDTVYCSRTDCPNKKVYELKLGKVINDGS